MVDTKQYESFKNKQESKRKFLKLFSAVVNTLSYRVQNTNFIVVNFCLPSPQSIQTSQFGTPVRAVCCVKLNPGTIEENPHI